MHRLALSLALLLAPLVAPLTAQAAPPEVTTDIAPVQSLVAMVMQGLGEPAVILPPGAEPHHHSMRPSEARALANADLVFWVGPELTPWLGGAIGGLAEHAQVVTLSQVTGTVHLPLRTGADLGGVVPDSTDPHMWLDPDNAMLWLDSIAVALAESDPEHADRYSENAARAQTQIAATADRIDAELAPTKSSAFIVTHDSWQYFEARFGVTAAGALLNGEADRPNPSRLFALRKLVAARGITCVLAEPPVNTGLIASVFDTARVHVTEASPLGTGLAPGATLYPALLLSIADALAQCATP